MFKLRFSNHFWRRNYVSATIAITWIMCAVTSARAQGTLSGLDPSSPLAIAQNVGFGGLLATMIWMNYQAQLRAERREERMAESHDAREERVAKALEHHTQVITAMVSRLDTMDRQHSERRDYDHRPNAQQVRGN